MPAALQPAAAVLATAGEVIFAIALITGFLLREAAVGSGVLLTAFGISMALALGMKAPLDYSVFSAAAAAFSLAVLTADHKREIREEGKHE
jgi:cell division protein FtsW (lipid II flippase)